MEIPFPQLVFAAIGVNRACWRKEAVLPVACWSQCAVSIEAECRDGVYAPLQEVEEATPGEVYQVFSGSELKRLAADLPWLKASERSFEFWENEEDAVCDSL